MKRIFALIVAMLLGACSNNESTFLESLEGHWRAQGDPKFEFTVKKIDRKLVALAPNNLVFIMTPNGKFASDTNRLPVKFDWYTHWPERMIPDIVAENVGKIHKYDEEQIRSAIAETKNNSSYFAKLSAYNFLQTLGLLSRGDNDARRQLYSSLIAELESQKSVIQAPSTSEGILELGANGQLILTDESNKSETLVRERVLDHIDTEKISGYQKILDARAAIIDQEINQDIAKFNEELAKLKKG
jgi:hypothetical protein